MPDVATAASRSRSAATSRRASNGSALIRLLRYRPRLLADFTDHARAPGFLTTVAGTCVLGGQFVILAGNLTVASLLWLVGGLLWIALIYAFFTAMTVCETKYFSFTAICLLTSEKTMLY